MRSRFFFAAVLLAAFVPVASQAIAADKVFGKGVSATDTMLVSQLLDNPEEFAGKVVRVQGTAVGVCAHRGCWVALASDREMETITIKVKDGEIVFPAEIKGEMVIAEGVFTIIKKDSAAPKKACPKDEQGKHEEHGEEAGSEKVGCQAVYLVAGTGAVVLADAEAKTEVKAKGSH